MHPIILAMFLLGMTLIFQSKTEESSLRVDPPWEKVSLKQGSLNITEVASARVIPHQQWTIKAPISGRIQHLLVDVGEHFKKGQVIAWMQPMKTAKLLDSVQSHSVEYIKQWTSNAEPIAIRAPWNGVVLQRPVFHGREVNRNTPLFVFTDHLRIESQIPPSSYEKIKKSKYAWISIDLFPDLRFTAKVLNVNKTPRLLGEQKIHDVLLQPIKIPPVVKAGMTGTSHFLVHSKRRTNLIPNWLANGLQHSKVKVYVESLYGEALEKEIFVGHSDGHSVEVLSPLKKGTTFLYQPATLVEDLSQVHWDFFQPEKSEQ